MRGLVTHRQRFHPLASSIGATLVLIVAGAVVTTPVSAHGSTVIRTPNPSTSTNVLDGVDELSPTSAWAVGYYANASNVDQTLILSWNGTKWLKVASPNIGTSGNQLNAVTAFGASDAWAVGSYTDSSGQHTLALHWDGTKWKHVATPSPGGASSLSAVSGTSSNDVWAVGSYSPSSFGDTLTLHWNGTAWSQVPSPNPSSALSAGLAAVTAVAANNAWAVGTSEDSSSSVRDTLVLHWDGTSWSQVASPNPQPSGENWALAVSADGATDIWASGWACATVSGTCGFNENHFGFLMHWNGAAWSLVATHVPSTSGSALEGLSARASNDAWAVGNRCTTSTCAVTDTLVLHWNGTRWSSVHAPNPSTADNDLSAVSAQASNSAFAVGFYFKSSVADTLAVKWNGTSWVKT